MADRDLVERLKERRAELARTLLDHPITRASGGLPAAVLFSPPVAVRNHDVEHPFRAGSDLAYLTGFEEPEAVLVLLPGEKETRSVLFVRPRDKEREMWTGRRAGPEGAVSRFGVDEAHPVAELSSWLPRLLRGRRAVFAHLGQSAADDRVVFDAVGVARARSRREGVWPIAFGDLAEVLHRFRQVKSDDEIALLERAVAATAAGHRRAMAVTRAGLYESDLEAVLTYEFRRGGAKRHGYEPIVAAGDNACILHYVENQDPLEDGDLVLIDAGAEHSLYTADVTRTFPVSGRFSPAQRRVYELVLRANEAAIEAARPGASLKQLDEVARRVLAEGLKGLGLLSGEIDELVEKRPFEGMTEGHPGRAPLDRYYPHSTGHWLGMDVHDVGPYHDGREPTPFSPGMVFTVEPGLYFPRDDDGVPEEYRGIGVRIEDDLVITEVGHRVLTAAIPKRPDEVEALVGTETL